MSKKKKEVFYRKIREIAVFDLSLRENVDQVTVALARAGYFVRILGDNDFGGSVVVIYTDRDLPQ
jgi:hypothetical protein